MARGGRGAGAAGRGAPSREVQVSKKLSWLLRHGAEKEGLKLGKGGYVNLAEVLSNRTINHLKPPPTIDEIREIVVSNEKQRFSLIHVSSIDNDESTQPGTTTSVSSANIANDKDPSNYLIRANQGHSLKVDDEGLLTPITLEADNLPPVVVHGTRMNLWPQIVASGGLKPMSRNHVHFATGIPKELQDRSKALSSTALSSSFQGVDSPGFEDAAQRPEVVEIPDAKDSPAVLSGMRNSSNVLIFLDLKGALEKGIKFLTSENGVVLSEGDEGRVVGLEFFKRVEDLRDKRVLVEKGKILVEVENSKNHVGKKK